MRARTDALTEEAAAAESASFRFQSSCSLNFNEQIPNGFYSPWGEYPEVELSGEYRIPPLALLESIEPDLSDPRDVVVVDQRRDEDLQGFLLQLVETVGALEDTTERAAAVARVVAERLGGPVESDDALAGKWAEESYNLRLERGKLTVPIGRLTCGLRRHRALLFKVRGKFFWIWFVEFSFVCFVFSSLLASREERRHSCLRPPSFDPSPTLGENSQNRNARAHSYRVAGYCLCTSIVTFLNVFFFCLVVDLPAT